MPVVKSKSVLSGLRVAEAMRKMVVSLPPSASLAEAVRRSTKYKVNALLVEDADGRAAGVVSKTDLIIAYKHGLPPDETAEAIMSSPARACGSGDFLIDALKLMIFSDVHRLFVHDGDLSRITGVLSLSDAARLRSGACRACMTSRIDVQSGP